MVKVSKEVKEGLDFIRDEKIGDNDMDSVIEILCTNIFH